MPFIRRAFLTLAAIAALSAVAASGDSVTPPTPDPQQLIDLVRDTVIAVDEGNKSGDYARLHAMGSQAFMASNPPDRLARQFESLRDRRFDMAPARTLTPLTTRAPTMDRNGLLRILGFYEIGRVQLVYDLLYAYEGARWRVAALSLKPRDIPEPPKLMQPK